MLRQLKQFYRSVILPDRLFLLRKAKQEKILYLTFDDGPVAGVIEPLLALLDKHQIKATFFVLGSRAAKHPELMSAIHSCGHTIANHSYSHPAFNKISHADKLKQVVQANDIIQQTTGQACRLFRAPQGRWDLRLLLALGRKKITAVHWSRDSMDFLKEPAENIAARFNQQPVQAGDIILFHDDDIRCVEALELLLPLWLKQGYRFDALENNLK
ncbi:Peptidoglycan/xylan/chitin deacetylase, PgdA/CDA1 family [Colwellia chukchiensis]|uniref:Peptidoglycan/xylan/chitin deacetylase, PgdA/CDA1 family n=1 Tax=Colwellia chukchiensis TaxID=641665 RepID=A0A1H7SE84_9GAMM|nr:polysaccharide deacetylase family protein [Colwellia chukchiensis]SEL70639.1 Peptidoglycan/xylan/chitin deacetylase, PgdA/CDA1 family [Colwellia chukchiensis]